MNKETKTQTDKYRDRQSKEKDRLGERRQSGSTEETATRPGETFQSEHRS